MLTGRALTWWSEALPLVAVRLDPAAVDAAAIRALTEELLLAPKPGLVTPGDSGSHADMDARTFLAAIFALRGTFGAAARAGLLGDDPTGDAGFARLRAIGMAAEARMLRATGGVNTHRGAIFALGLIAAAAGRAARIGAVPSTVATLREEVRRLSAAVRHGLPPGTSSHGAIAARLHGAGGARQEAERGFPHVFDVALPALAAARVGGAGRTAAGIHALMTLVATVPDTNLLHRGGAQGLAFARGEARAFLDAGSVHVPGWRRRVLAIHRAFVGRRLSPGGSADLLAAALFVEALCRRDAIA